MASSDPPYLTVGTKVSSKFKGAYCESDIEHMSLDLRIKVSFKDPPFGHAFVSQKELPNVEWAKGLQTVMVHPTTRKKVKCQIVHIKDNSQYYVVYNDGDDRYLRRTQLVLQGGRHFAADGNMDAMPLTNPEAIAAPVRKRNQKKSPKSAKQSGEEEEEDDDDDVPSVVLLGKGRRRAAENAMSAIGTQQGKVNDTLSDESADESARSSSRAKRRRRTATEDVEEEDVDDDEDSKLNGSTASSSRNRGNAADSSQLTKRELRKLEKEQEKERKKKLKEEQKEKKAREKQEKKEQKEKDKKKRKQEKEDKKKKKVKPQVTERVDDVIKVVKVLIHRRSKKRSLHHRKFRFIRRRLRVAPMKQRRHGDENKKDKSSGRKSTRKSGPSRNDEDDRDSSNDNQGTSDGRTGKGNPPNDEPEKKKPKSLIRVCYSFRNLKLFIKGKRFVTVEVVNGTRHVRYCQYFPSNKIYGVFKNIKFLRTEKRKRIVRNWFRGAEFDDFSQFVVIHENYEVARKFLENLEGDEMVPLEDRYESGLNFNNALFRKHFQKSEWYLGMVFPEQIADPNGSEFVQRVVRNMTTNELVKVWENDLIPLKWIPKYENSEKSSIVRTRQIDLQSNFRLSWSFAEHYTNSEYHIPSLAAMLKVRRNDLNRTNQHNVVIPKKLDVDGPPPVRQNDEMEEDSVGEDEEGGSEDNESDYDSDSLMENGTTEDGDRFVAGLLQFYDQRGINVEANATVQGHEVNLWHMYNLAKGIGAPKRVYTANPWALWSKKLVPLAVNAADALKKVFADHLDEYLQFQVKMNFPSEAIQPRGERKQILPGQYSESRKKRAQAMSQAPSTSQAALLSPNLISPPSRGRGSTVGGRKRKQGSPTDSIVSRRRGSRTTTLSPDRLESLDVAGPSSVVSDDDQSTIDGDRRGRKSKTSASRRTTSGRDDSVVMPTPKKGRPRKHQDVTPTSSGKAVEKHVEDISNYMPANVISNIDLFTQIQANYQNQWFQAHACDVGKNYTDELKAIFTGLQDSNATSLSEEVESSIREIWNNMSTKAHYTGWNSRYDEFLPLAQVMVLQVDQVGARSRFRKLPDGRHLKPKLLAMVESKFCQYKDPSKKPNYFHLACEAFQMDKDENDIVDRSVEKKKEVKAEQVATASRSTSPEEDGSDSDDETSNRKQKRDDSGNTKNDNRVSAGTRERSPTPSSISSTSIVTTESPGSVRRPRESTKSPESVESGKSRERDVSKENESRPSSSNSPEIGDKSSSPSLNSEGKSTEQDQQEDEGSPELGVEVNFDSPTRHDRSPNFSPPQHRGLLDESEEEPDSDGESKATIKELESDSDEPEYPQVTRSPEVEESGSEPPQLQPPVDHLNSEGSSNYPALSRQGSSATSMAPISYPTTALAHSGPLTLEEVPVSTGPLTTATEKGIISPETSNSKRRRVSSISKEPSASKRMRRASEKSTEMVEDVQMQQSSPLPSPKNLLTSQFSSGALTLDMMPQETSGPIEPITIQKSGRRKTASPTLTSSGPLTFHSPVGPSPSTSTSTNVKVRPPGAPPLGRPKKNSVVVLTKKTEELEEEVLSSLFSEQSKETEGTSEEGSASPSEDKEDELNGPLSPRGSIAGRGGKRKRGGKVGGFNNGLKPGVKGSATRKNTQEEEETEEPEAPSASISTPPSSTPSRPDSFAAQKARMAKKMEEAGTHKDFSQLGLDYEKVLRDSPPEDINMNLEELSNEVRDIYYSAKSDLLALEKAFRKSEAARKKAEAPPSEDVSSAASTSSNS